MILYLILKIVQNIVVYKINMNKIDELIFDYECNLIDLDEIVQNIDINTYYDCTGKTILMKACQNKNIKVVSYLINAGADVNLRDKYGATALSYACTCCNSLNGIRCVNKLLDAGADANITLHYKSVMIEPYRRKGMIPYSFIEYCDYDIIKKCADLKSNEDRCESPLICLLMDKKIDVTWHDILMRMITVSDVLYQDVAGKTAHDYYIKLYTNKEILSEEELFLLKNGKRFISTKSARC